MKKHYLVFSIILLPFLLLTNCLFAQTNVWIQRDTVNGGPKTGCVSFFINGTGYLGTGYDYNSYKRTFFRYQINKDDWDKIESLGGELGSGLNRNNAVAFVINGKGYVGTGQGSMLYMDDFWEYDPITKAWTQKATFEGTPRRCAVGFAINNKGYIGTGQDASGLRRDMWEYNPATNTWTQKANFAGTARKQAVAMAMGGIAWVGTGDDGILKNDWWEYDPQTDIWKQKNNFGGTPRAGAIAANMGFQGFVGLGYDNTFNYVKDFWEYHIISDTWTKRMDFPGTPRASAAAFGSWSSIYVGTGYDGLPKEDFYEYVPILSIQDLQAFSVNSLVYPNPVTNHTFTIQVNAYLDNCRIRCFSIDGKEIPVSFSVAHIQEKTILHVSIQEQATGTYFYKVESQQGLHTSGKFIVANE